LYVNKQCAKIPKNRDNFQEKCSGFGNLIDLPLTIFNTHSIAKSGKKFGGMGNTWSLSHHSSCTTGIAAFFSKKAEFLHIYGEIQHIS